MEERKLKIPIPDKELSEAYNKFRIFAEEKNIHFQWDQDDWMLYWDFWIFGYIEGKLSMLLGGKEHETKLPTL